MKTRVKDFAAFVVRDYDENIGQMFLKSFPNPEHEVSFGDAMEVLDGILSRETNPVYPSFAPTNSDSPERPLRGRLIVEA